MNDRAMKGWVAMVRPAGKLVAGHAQRRTRGAAWSGTSGLSLLELMLAFALFAIIVAAGMQAYVGAHSGMIVQEQRTQAANLARSVLSNLRDARDSGDNDFPESLLARYPDGGVVGDVRSLQGTALGGRETITVDYEDLTAIPVSIRVTVEWLDPRNRPIAMDVTTMLGEQ